MTMRAIRASALKVTPRFRRNERYTFTDIAEVSSSVRMTLKYNLGANDHARYKGFGLKGLLPVLRTD
jgi:hypothetical protein